MNYADDAVTAPEIEKADDGKIIVRGIYRSLCLLMPEIGDEVIVESRRTHKKEMARVIGVDIAAGTYDVEIQP